MNTLSYNLQTLINSISESENELSKLIGITVASLNKIKNGINDNPTLHTLEKIATYFGISVAQLIGEAPLNLDLTQNLGLIPIFDMNELLNINFLDINLNTHNSWKKVELNPEWKNVFGVNIYQDIAPPLITKNTILIAQKKLLNSNDTAILELNNNILIKKIMIEGDIKIAKSMNNSVPDIRLTTSYQIIGIILKIIKTL